MNLLPFNDDSKFLSRQKNNKLRQTRFWSCNTASKLWCKWVCRVEEQAKNLNYFRPSRNVSFNNSIFFETLEKQPRNGIILLVKVRLKLVTHVLLLWSILLTVPSRFCLLTSLLFNYLTKKLNSFFSGNSDAFYIDKVLCLVNYIMCLQQTLVWLNPHTSVYRGLQIIHKTFSIVR